MIPRRFMALFAAAILLLVSTTSALAVPGDEHWDDRFGIPGNGIDGRVYALAADSKGNVYAGGTFTAAGPVSAQNIARWDGSQWTALDTDTGINVEVLAVDRNDVLYVGGIIIDEAGQTRYIARWDGESWTPIATNVVGAIRVLATDSRGNVYAGGDFTKIGDVQANRVARWDGEEWSALGGGMNGAVQALAADRQGNIYAGGNFSTADDLPAHAIVRWNGSVWSSVGEIDGRVQALAIDSQDHVYAAGDLEDEPVIPETPGDKVVYWNGDGWQNLGQVGYGSIVNALAVDNFDVVYAVGTAYSRFGAFIRRWDQTSWSNLGSGIRQDTQRTDISYLRAVTITKQGDVYFGGMFDLAGPYPSASIARYAASELRPVLSIGDVVIDESQDKATHAEFDVSLSATSSQTVTLDYAVQDGTARAGLDYVAQSGTLTIPAGQTSGTIRVPIIDDERDEDDQTFVLKITNAVHVLVGDDQAVATIIDDDQPPTISIADASLSETRSGQQALSFTVSLSAASERLVTVHYATADGSATAGQDFIAQSGILPFAPGVTQRNVVITIKDDALVEGDETLTVDLSNPTNATVADGQGAGTIVDDEAPASDPSPDATEKYIMYLPSLIR